MKGSHTTKSWIWLLNILIIRLSKLEPVLFISLLKHINIKMIELEKVSRVLGQHNNKYLKNYFIKLIMVGMFKHPLNRKR